MVRILGLFQFGSSQNLKVWGCMTCSHLTSKLSKHQTQTAFLLFKWRRCHCCSHRSGWAGPPAPVGLGSPPASWPSPFIPAPSWTCSAQLLWFHALLVPILTFGYSILGFVFLSARTLHSEIYSGFPLSLIFFLQTHSSWVVVLYSDDFIYHPWADGPPTPSLLSLWLLCSLRD